MKTIAINSNNDIYIDSSNNLVIKNDLAAMGDILVNKCQTNLGELLYNALKGIDFFNTILSSPSYPDLFQNQLLTQIEQTNAVERIDNYKEKIQNSVYSYTTEIQTEYGEVSLNG